MSSHNKAAEREGTPARRTTRREIIAQLRRAGRDDDYIKSYLHGVDQVNEYIRRTRGGLRRGAVDGVCGDNVIEIKERRQS